MKKFTILIIVLALIAGGVYVYNKRTPTDEVETTETGDVGDLIVVTSPEADAEISSPLTVSGEVRGNWYFEATFPVEVLAADGRTIGRGFASAQGEWMTEEFVPFLGSVTFTAPTDGMKDGAVVFKKNNPSGLPEHDDSISISVKFQ